MRADDARIACPLFQAEYGGEVPTSALQLTLRQCSRKKYRELISLWHSRLPDAGEFYSELRRFAIAPDAPKNTASRLLSVMVRFIRKNRPHVVKLISYQDTEVHVGTIYKASGWQSASISTKSGWLNHPRHGNTGGHAFKLQSNAPKIRWELPL
jgi:hypothetical protein